MTAIGTVKVTGKSPAERGGQLGSNERDELVATLRTYDSLFAAYALDEPRVRALAGVSRRALEDWAPDLAAEADALADAAGVDRWRVHALNARTEILAAGGVIRRGECSTIALTAPRTLSVQTWDWHRELADGWQLVQHVGTPLPFITLTERGMLGKIGINAAGVGLHFNILGHASDSSVEGVPVHAVARRVLDSATDVAHAERLIRSAPLQASSCYTVVDAAGVSCLEACPAGVGEPPPHGGPMVHTNHFLDPGLAPGDLRVGPEPDTVDRLRVLEQRAATLGPAPRPEAMVAALQAHDDPDGAPVCCHAAPSAPLGDGWETLATVVLEPARRRMGVLRGGPCQATDGTWLALTA